MELIIPQKREQQKIGNFFFCIDKKLELQQERIDILKEYKKGMMQRIFSQEIRFKGENGENYPDWEEKKLGEVAEIYSGGTPSTQNKEFWNGDILWVTPTDVTSNDKYLYDTEKKITNLGLKKSSAKLLPINSILMTSRATVGEVVINKVEASTNQGFKSFVVSDENNHEFLYYRLITLKNK